jgi:hypothetical protein
MKAAKYLILIGVLCTSLNSLAHADLKLIGSPQLRNSDPDTELAAFIRAGGDADATTCLREDFPSNPPIGDVFVNGDFTFTIGQNPNGQYTVTVDFDLSGSQVVCGFAIKNGGQTVNLYSVDPGQTSGSFVLLVPGNPSGHFGNVSHITVFCCPGNMVPDSGATAMLLGGALTGLGVARRYLKR